MHRALRLLASTTFVVISVTTGCSGGSSGHSNCDAGACDALASTIIAHGGGAGTCNEPTAQFEQACAAYATCLQQCGQ